MEIPAFRYLMQAPRMTPKAEELGRAVREENRQLAIDLITQGADPFDQGSSEVTSVDRRMSAIPFTCFRPNGFDEASNKKDIGLLLHMCAEPGTPWWTPSENRFFVSRHKALLAPSRGRDLSNIEIPTTPESMTMGRPEKGGLLRFRGATKEGLEVLLMHGYKLTVKDYEKILEDRKKWKSLLALALAAELPNIPDSILHKLMCLAVGCSFFTPFISERDPLTSEMVRTNLPFSNHDLATALLKSGADPNAHWNISGSTPNPNPPTLLMKALQNEDEDMAELLMRYGADVKVAGVQELAANVGMQHLVAVDSNRDTLVANSVAYGKQLRKQFMGGFDTEVKKRSAVLVVAFMRYTRCAPQKHLMSNLILKYCPLGFNLWEIDEIKSQSGACAE